MKPLIVPALLPALLWACGSHLSSAAAIQYLGVQTDVETYADDSAGWRGSSTIKTHDPDGDHVFGTDGYRMFPSVAVSLPSYASSITAGSVGGWSGGGYALIDDPAGGADILSGVYFINGAGVGETYDIFHFEFSGSVPPVVVVHLMAGSSDIPGSTTNTSITIAQTTGGSSSVSTPLDSSSWDFSGPDWYSFRISGAAAGDVFTVRLTNDDLAPRTFHVGGIAFDSVAIPEPSATQLFGLVAACLLLRRRVS